MSFVRAKEYLKRLGLDEKVMEFEVSSATVAQAAVAVGCTEAEIAKSLTFLVDEKPIMIVTAGDMKIDNSKYKAYFHSKAKMIPFESVEKVVGHAAGGVCPFAANENVEVYLDESMKRFEVVYPACGNSNSAVKLTIAELYEASGCRQWIDVCKSIL